MTPVVIEKVNCSRAKRREEASHKNTQCRDLRLSQYLVRLACRLNVGQLPAARAETPICHERQLLNRLHVGMTLALFWLPSSAGAPIEAYNSMQRGGVRGDSFTSSSKLSGPHPKGTGARHNMHRHTSARSSSPAGSGAAGTTTGLVSIDTFQF